ncbi:hypothetical protein ABKN59_011264 [Abortiporus biennis]
MSAENTVPLNSHLSISSLLDKDPTPLNSHFDLSSADSTFDDDDHNSDLERRSRSSFSSDNDTASQRSISLSSPPKSPTARLSLAQQPGNHTDLSSQDYSALLAASLGTPTPTSNTSQVDFIRQSLSSNSLLVSGKRESNVNTLSSNGTDDDDHSSFMRRLEDGDEDDEIALESPISSAAPSILSKDPPALATPPPLPSTTTPTPATTTELNSSASTSTLPERSPSFRLSKPPLPSRSTTSVLTPSSSSSTTYPPLSLSHDLDRDSVASFGSGSTTYSKKARPESLLLQGLKGPLVLGLALVDFNHLVGPKIEFSIGEVFEDEEIANILPFLALPDGAHLTTEDYSYFHLVPSSPNPTTLFGISCNRQIKSADLVNKHVDVTRSTVQKAVVILASKPVFGPIRDRLGVITRTLFAQKDFSDLSILNDFYASLESGLKGQLTESGLYMGTSLRELVHTFRQRTLVLLKALMLQKKIMFYGHPVERLCTFQYSLCTLVPGLLQNLDDCGSPPLCKRAGTLQKPTELKTSDPKSMMAFVGLPLDLFGKDAFFQPYLPLQQLDMLKDTKSWLCGSTNSIVAQQKEIDLLVNIETGAFEFKDPKLERSAGLTAADRKWMDDIVRDVNEGWIDEDLGGTSLQFKGSDDYLRQKFDEYITGALSSVKYADFIAKGRGSGVLIADGSGDPNSIQDFNMLWMSEFKKTNAYEVWDRVTDPMLFDLVEPRHPCSEKPSVVTDIGIRLSEGLQDLKIEQQLAPTREAISRTITAGSTGFFKAMEGVKERWMQRNTSSSSSDLSTSASENTVEITKEDLHGEPAQGGRSREGSIGGASINGIRPLSLASTKTSTSSSSTSDPPSTPTRSSASPSIASASSSLSPEPVKATLAAWGSGLGSFFARRSSQLSVSSTPSSPATSPRPPNAARPSSLSGVDEDETKEVRSESRPGSGLQRVISPLPSPKELGFDELHPKDLDKEKEKLNASESES